MAQQRTGATLLIDSLRANGVDRVFGVPGESYLAVLDALHDAPEIDLVVCRQEGGAAIMADADAKLTGRPGICFVTRGPGATNAASGVHIAFQDSTPMILFIGQVARGVVEREAFQEMDYRRMFGQMAKWVAEIDDPARVPEFISHAFHLALSGRPGPVVLALPEDMLTEEVPAVLETPAAAHRVAAHPGPREMADLHTRLTASQRPLLMLGGGAWSPEAAEDIRAFAEAWGLPVCVSFRRQDLFDNGHDLYIGDVGIGINPKLAERVRTTDLLIAVGPRLGEMTTSGYSLFEIPTPAQPLVHVHPGAEELGRVYRPALAINAAPGPFAAAAKSLTGGAALQARTDWAAAARQDYLAWTDPSALADDVQVGDVRMGEIMGWLRSTLPDGTIMCNGAGNYTVWVHRFYRYRHYGTQLAPTSGSMGYGVPAAIAAKRRYPDKDVVAFAGDGCFLMTGQELATAMQYDAKIIIVVVNNGMYGTIRMHQEREYPGRVHGTALVNPDFADLARAYGGHGETVTRTGDFQAAFERAQKADKPALIEVKIDPEAITPMATLSKIRAAAEG